MNQLLGEYECKIDSKGRLRLPTGLVSSLTKLNVTTLVLARGFEECLNLYPVKEWEAVSAKVNQLSDFVEQNRQFKRYFFRGASEINLIGTDRILLQRRLLEYAGIDKDVTLTTINNRIEVWSTDTYNKMLESEPEDFSAIAEEVMGRTQFGGTSTSDSGVGPR